MKNQQKELYTSNGEKFSKFFEHFRHERSILLLLSLTGPKNLKQTPSLDYERNVIRKSCSGEVSWAKMLKRTRSYSFFRLIFQPNKFWQIQN